MILLIDENVTSGEFGGGPSDGSDLSAFVPRPPVWSILLQPQDRDMSSTVNMCDECLLVDSAEDMSLKPILKKLRSGGDALPLLNLRYLGWTTVFTTAASREDSPPFATRRAERGRWGAASPTIAPDALLKNFDGQTLVANSWLSCCRLFAERCPNRDRRHGTPLGQRSHCDGSAMETQSLLECPHVRQHDLVTRMMLEQASFFITWGLRKVDNTSSSLDCVDRAVESPSLCRSVSDACVLKITKNTEFMGY